MYPTHGDVSDSSLTNKPNQTKPNHTRHSSKRLPSYRPPSYRTPSNQPPQVAFLPKEPLLLTLGADNALKCWLFDAPDGSGRLLRSREGHSAPPMLRGVRWYGHTTLATMSHGDDATALQLLSAGGDKAVGSKHHTCSSPSHHLAISP